MKTVFNNQMVAHVWAQMKQPHGHNSGNSKHFDGAVAYSYREPVAHIVEARHERRVLLYVPNQWGVTTARHITSYRRAFGSGHEFEVPDIFPHDVHRSHTANVAYLLSKYEEARARLMRVPCDSWRVRNIDVAGNGLHLVTAAHETLRELADKLRTYIDLFQLPDVATCTWESDADAIIARRDRLANDPKRAAQRELRVAARHQEMLKAAAERFAREGMNRAAFLRGDYTYSHVSDIEGGALLRIQGTQIQTSWGAEVPVVDAIRVLPRLFAARLNIHGTVSHLLCDWGIGHFKIDVVNQFGIVAGCHTIYWAELERIAAALGVPS